MNRLEQYSLYRSYLEHEDNLINQRIGWMTTIQSFLFATYGFLLQRKIEAAEKLLTLAGNSAVEKMRPEFITSREHLDIILLHTDVFIYVVCIAGFATAWSTYWTTQGAMAAGAALDKIADHHFKFTPQLEQDGRAIELTEDGYPRLTFGGLSSTVKRPLLVRVIFALIPTGTDLLPRILLSIWALLFAVTAYFQIN